MKVAVLGSGAVAKALGAGLVKHGHEVMLGSRSPAKLADWTAHSNGRTGTFARAAIFGEAIVLAAKGSAALHALEMAGPEALAGKVVIDTTNPLAESPPTSGVLSFFTSLNESLMERLQAAYPDARFVKAFNSVGNELMVNPQFNGGRPTMFICGNDAFAKNIVGQILGQFGWEVADMGKAQAARAIEPLCILWCIPGFLRNEWNHAFKLLSP